jgi:TAT (twin-arginine translocation) pathway signal sequence
VVQAIEPVRAFGRISADRIHTAAGAAGKERAMERLSRRSFMKIAGAATGAAALAAAPPIARAAVGEEGAQPTHPTTGVPEEPVVAYVRDAGRGEVTVAAGTAEHTYRDRALVQRLLRAAGRKDVR